MVVDGGLHVVRAFSDVAHLLTVHCILFCDSTLPVFSLN